MFNNHILEITQMSKNRELYKEIGLYRIELLLQYKKRQKLAVCFHVDKFEKY